jgi:hypothetical protein
MSLATYLLLTTSSDVFTAHSLATTDLTASSNSIGRFIYRTIFFRVRLTNAQHSRKYRGSAATISISAFKYRPALAASNRAVRLQPPIQDRYCCIHVQCTNNEVEFVVVQRMITLPAYDAASQQVFGRTRAKHHRPQAISCTLVHRSKLKKPRKPECWTRPSRLGRLNVMQLTDTPCWRCDSGCVLSPPRDQPKVP